jgi:RNA polymerase sigma-70 factor (ECF subfamily)
MTEDELITACLKNNPRAQKALFEKYSGKLMGVCLRYATDRDEAQDMLQDGFVKIFQKLDSYTGEGSFGGWVHRLMVNTCLDALRKNKAMGFSVEIEKADFQMDGVEDALSQLRTQDLLRLIQDLPDGYRVVFNMFAIEGYGHAEIAESLGISENTSKSQYRKAKFKLQEALHKLESRI